MKSRFCRSAVGFFGVTNQSRCELNKLGGVTSHSGGFSEAKRRDYLVRMDHPRMDGYVVNKPRVIVFPCPLTGSPGTPFHSWPNSIA